MVSSDLVLIKHVIFIDQTEAPLMIKPLLGDMTKSELHAVMTGGFATIAGSVLATYILFGVSTLMKYEWLTKHTYITKIVVVINTNYSERGVGSC